MAALEQHKVASLDEFDRLQVTLDHLSKCFLILGDGDASFSRSLVEKGVRNILVTFHDSESELYDKYPTAKDNLDYIQRKCDAFGHPPQFKINACNIHLYPSMRHCFDFVIFNFPFKGGNPYENIEEHRTLIKRFLLAVPSVLKPDGEVRLTVMTKEPYQRWNLPQISEEISHQTGFEVSQMNFDDSKFPGYIHRLTDGAGKKGDRRVKHRNPITLMYSFKGVRKSSFNREYLIHTLAKKHVHFKDNDTRNHSFSLSIHFHQIAEDEEMTAKDDESLDPFGLGWEHESNGGIVSEESEQKEQVLMDEDDDSDDDCSSLDLSESDDRCSVISPKNDDDNPDRMRKHRKKKSSSKRKRKQKKKNKRKRRTAKMTKSVAVGPDTPAMDDHMSVPQMDELHQRILVVLRSMKLKSEPNPQPMDKLEIRRQLIKDYYPDAKDDHHQLAATQVNRALYALAQRCLVRKLPPKKNSSKPRWVFA